MTNISRIRTLILRLLLVSAALSPIPLLAQTAKVVSDIPIATMKRVNLCGNSVVDSGEVCDNGMQCENNTTICKSAMDCVGIGAESCAPRSGDGCAADCLSVEMKRVTALAAEVPAQKLVVDTVAPLRAVDTTPINVAAPVEVVEAPLAKTDAVVVNQREAVVVSAPLAQPEAKIITRVPLAERPVVRAPLLTADTQSPDLQPADPCLDKFPDTTSLDYKCCEASSLRFTTVRGAKGVTSAGGLTAEETTACQCREDPTSIGCPCLGKHQIDDLNACASASGDASSAVTFKIDEASGKAIGSVGDLMHSETSLCACAAPQPFDKHMACDTGGVRRVLSTRFFGPNNLQFACLYQAQADAIMGAIKSAGGTVEPVEIDDNPRRPGYQITESMSSAACAFYGGKSPETQPETQPETRRIALVEEKHYEDAPMLDAEGEQPTVTAQPVAVPTPLERIATPADVTCTIVKPQCPCTPPEVPTTQPAPPEPPPPPLPPAVQAQPKLRLCFCRWHDFEALCPDTNESIVLKDECPALTIQAFTSADAHRLYMTASDYFSKPEDAARKKKLLDAANSNLMSTTELDTNPMYSLSTLGNITEDGATLAPVADRKSVKLLFQKNALVLSDDGTLKVNDPQAALQVLSGSPAALTSAPGEGPQVVAMSDLFKNEPNTPQMTTITMGFDSGVATGGASGCGARASLLPDDAPWTAVGPWTLAMAALTLITWRFRPLKRRASTGSSINTRAKGSSTKS